MVANEMSRETRYQIPEDVTHIALPGPIINPNRHVNQYLADIQRMFPTDLLRTVPTDVFSGRPSSFLVKSLYGPIRKTSKRTLKIF